MPILNSYFNWSSGKDSALALYHAQRDPKFKIHTLLTTLNEAHQRVSMHGIRAELLDQQAAALGLPLHKIWLPETVSMEEYRELMKAAVTGLKQQGWDHAIFGDIFLEDLRRNRETQLDTMDIQAHFPLWKRDTRELVAELLETGFKAVIVAVDGSKLTQDHVGKQLDQAFLDSLPDNVDPCGEYGEFHTFVYDGPNFSHPVAFELGEVVHKHYLGNQSEKPHPGFYFQELLPLSVK